MPSCSRTASTTGRGAMAQQVAAPAGKEIQVAVSLVVPDVRPLAPHQRHGEAVVVGDDVLLESLTVSWSEFNPRTLTISVPTPRLVYTSSSSECRSRPSMMWILRTPVLERLQARLHLGDHARLDGARCRSAPRPARAVSEWISDSGSFLSRRTPLTSLRKTSFSAPRACGHGRGRRVGVDVELLAVAVQAHRGDHRHHALAAELGRSVARSTRVTWPTCPRSIGLPPLPFRQDPFAVEHVLWCGNSAAWPGRRAPRSGRPAAR